MQDKFAELEQMLNSKYKNKAITDKKGLCWYVKKIKVINKNEAEIILTDLTIEHTVTKELDELEKILK